MGINKQFTGGDWTINGQPGSNKLATLNPCIDVFGGYPKMRSGKADKITLHNNFNRVLTDEELAQIKISSADGLYKDFPLKNAPFTVDNTITGSLFLTYIGIVDMYVSGIVDLPQERGLSSFPLENIDLIREEILYWNNASTFYLNDKVGTLEPVKGLIQRINNDENNKYNTSINQFGLLLKTYQSDLFNNWIIS